MSTKSNQLNIFAWLSNLCISNLIRSLELIIPIIWWLLLLSLTPRCLTLFFIIISAAFSTAESLSISISGADIMDMTGVLLACKSAAHTCFIKSRSVNIPTILLLSVITMALIFFRTSSLQLGKYCCQHPYLLTVCSLYFLLFLLLLVLALPIWCISNTSLFTYADNFN